jgi:tRNA wybutosine-synthesizing protein 2
MFSPGNVTERVRMGEVVSPGERVLDMFAGIGYFSLPMARSGASVTAIERNRDAFRYLVENAELNEVSDRIRPIRADCGAVGDWHQAGHIDLSADRVVMGHYDAHQHLETAIQALEAGGILHLHEATPDALVWDRPVSRVEAAAETANRTATVVDRRRIKTHAPGVWHVVLDVQLS